MKRKKICFVTTIADTVFVFLLDQIKLLHENGYDVTVVCNNDEEFAQEHPAYITYVPIKMKRGIDLIGGIRATIQLFFLFRKEKFHLVQYSTPNASLYSALATKLANIPVRIYGQWGIRYVSFTGWKRAFFKFLEKIICYCSTVIEPVSKSNLSFGIKEGLYDEKKGRVIWNGSSNGINLAKFDYSKRSVWQKSIRLIHQFAMEDFVIGFVGRLDIDKGVNELFAAFKQLSNKYKDVKLFVIGSNDKPDSLDQGLFQWAKTSDSIVFIDDTDEIEKYFAAMDIFVLPSYREGFGSVVIEAEAMGTPVIVTNIPGPTDAMENGVTGFLVEKGNVSELVETIEKCMFNRDMLVKMGEEASKFAHDHFDQAQLLNYQLQDKDELYKTYVEKKKGIINATIS